jgi:hypothetical protein
VNTPGGSGTTVFDLVRPDRLFRAQPKLLGTIENKLGLEVGLANFSRLRTRTYQMWGTEMAQGPRPHSDCVSVPHLILSQKAFPDRPMLGLTTRRAVSDIQAYPDISSI